MAKMVISGMTNRPYIWHPDYIC